LRNATQINWEFINRFSGKKRAGIHASAEGPQVGSSATQINVPERRRTSSEIDSHASPPEKLPKAHHFTGSGSGGGRHEVLEVSEVSHHFRGSTASHGATASGNQVDDQDDQRYHQQYVNQAAGNVKAKAQ
jgi:hypothetical protein